MHLQKAIFAVLLLLAGSAYGQQAGQAPQQRAVPSHTPVLVIPEIGKGIVTVGGAWQFHVGDDPSWAQPSLDDSAWEPIHINDTWGAQGHPGYTGFAWYRRHVEIAPEAGSKREYRIVIMEAEDAYEVYWNGKLIGQYGNLPPHASWYLAKFARSFPLTGAPAGVLAIRVWKAPLDAFDPEDKGGVYLPQVGDPVTISLREQASEWKIISADLFDYGLVMLRIFIAFLCLVLWFRNRSEHLFVWVAVYTAAPVAIDILNRLFRIPFPWNVARALNQPIYVLFHVSMWFLLVWLLRLHENATLVRWTKILAYLVLAAGTADGILAFFWASATVWMQWADGLLDAFIILAEVFPFVVIYMGMRKKLDASRWAVALAALLLQLIDTAAAGSALGQRFTRWTFFDFINDSLFTIQGVRFHPAKITSLVLFVAILYAVYRYALEQQARHGVMERELQSAREIQQVLVPETLPALEGYAVTSAYQPAMEVGGDFFQIIPNPDGSTIVALGDVSGKGLKAGMNVSMIVGVLRAEAGTTSPAAMLGSLNRCLVGRMSGGFATGVIFRVDPDGTVTFANAGHLPPYLNGQEYPLDASLPLGLIGFAEYTEEKLQLYPGDQLSVYTDGLLEATSPTGELFGFERMKALFATRPNAQEAMKAAIDFGQEDDITVLTITRLAAGVESTTSLSAPTLTPEPAEA
ncbi:MAG TPA: SpoIIE family protein phosphatase [Terracidiphilus sp.]|nr:SpoIIE family protein phosphatase [Terracidiphilus sp.]